MRTLAFIAAALSVLALSLSGSAPPSVTRTVYEYTWTGGGGGNLNLCNAGVYCRTFDKVKTAATKITYELRCDGNFQLIGEDCWDCGGPYPPGCEAGVDTSSAWRVPRIGIAAMAAWPGSTLDGGHCSDCPDPDADDQEVSGHPVHKAATPATSHFVSVLEADPSTWTWSSDLVNGTGDVISPTTSSTFETTDSMILAEVHSASGGTFDVSVGLGHYFDGPFYTGCAHHYSVDLGFSEFYLKVTIDH